MTSHLNPPPTTPRACPPPDAKPCATPIGESVAELVAELVLELVAELVELRQTDSQDCAVRDKARMKGGSKSHAGVLSSESDSKSESSSKTARLAEGSQKLARDRQWVILNLNVR